MTDIVTPPTIATLPPAPLLTDTQADFNTKAFATVGALPGFVAEANALALATLTNATAAHERATLAQTGASTASAARDQAVASAVTAVNAPGTSGTSTTVMAVEAGGKSLVTQAGKAWAIGQALQIARTADPVGARMYAIISGYNVSSGAMTVQVPAGAFVGAGLYSDWTISLTATREGLATLVSPAFSGTPTAPTPAVSDPPDRIATLSALAYAAPAGMTAFFAMSAPPSGWVRANGAAVSRTAFAALFTALGTYYGVGDGSTTFNLPDLRGEFVRGWDDSRGIDPSRTFGSVQTSANLAHAHGITDAGHLHGTFDNGHGHVGTTNSAGGHNHGYQVPANVADADRGTASSIFSMDLSVNLPTDGAHSHTITATPNITNVSIQSATTNVTVQSSGGTESRPRNVALMACIKY